MEQDTSALPEELQGPTTEPVHSELLEGGASRKRGRILKGVGIMATGLVAGAIGVAAMQGSGGATSAASTTNTPQTGFQGGGPQGGFGGGGVPGQTRVFGTIASVGASSITVKASDGTSTTLAVNGTTEIVRNGATSSLSALKAGDQVVVHAVPSGSSTLAERILAGTSGTQRGPGGFGRRQPGQPGQPGPASGTGTTSTT
ncbi:MAG: hypothetical protein JWM02_3450 [Frankiales bacterium]|nr:hypothetical protein [Frankiales bacterium]